MKKNIAKGFAAVLMVLCVITMMAGCATTTPSETEEALAVIAGPNESVIVIQRKKTWVGSATISMKVWVDDEETALSIRNSQTDRFIVADGEHSIRAGSTYIDRGDAVSFSAAGEEITFFAEPQVGVLGARFKLTQTGKRNL
jgi:hypothetical protein